MKGEEGVKKYIKQSHVQLKPSFNDCMWVINKTGRLSTIIKMSPSRREVFTYLSISTIGVGGVIGSGAFSSVEAGRTVNIGAVGDASALVKFTGNNPDIVSDESVGSDSNNVIKLKQTALNEKTEAIFNNAVTVTNNGSQDVGLSVDSSQGIDPNSLVGTALDIRDSSDNSIVDDNGTAAITLAADGGSKDLSVVVNLREYPTADLSSVESIVFTARNKDPEVGVSENALTIDSVRAVRADSGAVKLLSVTNTFDNAADVSAEVTGYADNNTGIDLITGVDPSTGSPTTVSAGESIGVFGDVNPQASLGDTATVQLDISANGSSQSVTVSETVDLLIDLQSSYWNFDSISGSAENTVTEKPVTDDGIIGNNATYTGKVDNSPDRKTNARIEEQSHVLEIPDDAAYDFINNSAFTLSIYGFAFGGNISDAANNDQMLFDKTGTGTDGLQMFIREKNNGSGKGFLFISVDGQEQEVARWNPNGSAWQHIVWAHDENATPKNRVYRTIDDTAFNGDNHVDPPGEVKEVYTGDALGLPTATSAPFRVGNAVDGSSNLSFRWSNGIDEPKVYGRALSESEVQRLFDTSKSSAGGKGGNIFE